MAKKIVVFIVEVLLVFGAIYAGLMVTADFGKTKKEVTVEDMNNRLEKMYNNVNPKTSQAVASSVDLAQEEEIDELPDIGKYPLTVENTTDTYIEIFSSPEKAGTDLDGWLNVIAKEFNDAKKEIDGKQVSVAIRSLPSGLACDYIISGKYLPDAYTPSSKLWGDILTGNNINVSVVANRLVGNVAGVVVSNEKYDELLEKYGSINMKSITEAAENGDIIMGYTDPFTSTTGLNWLLATLATYDYKDPLSSKAIEGFNKFQANIPFVASTTLQMRDAANSGELSAFILERQLYSNSTDLRNDYKFIPFGVRHDNPLYAIGKVDGIKKKILEEFVNFTKTQSSQEIATNYGFNKEENYVCEFQEFSSDTVIKAQKVYKKNKGAGRANIEVFISDVSGSMLGDPLNNLKKSLINSIKYIDSDNYIGLVSYSNDVTINLPIGKFDLKQKSLFKGAVESLDAGGATATFDAITVALKMLLDAKKQYPDTRPMLFVLSDGEQNTGYSLSDISKILEVYKIPVYTIGYNADIKALEKISAINEAASINADSEDIVYKLKSLFNLQM